MLSSLLEYLRFLLNIDRFNDKLLNGVQIEGTRPIQKIATAVTASQHAIEETVRLNADLLLVHHGLFFTKGSSALTGPMRERTAYLLRENIHLLCFHLPLDAHQEFGNNWPVARALGWQNVKPFGPAREQIGVEGEISAIEGTQLFQQLQSYWNNAGVHLAQNPSKKIQRCAFISGKGDAFFEIAINQGVDCFITGTISDSVWHLARESSTHYMSFGHFCTERLGVQLLGEHLAKKFSLDHLFIDEENPY